MPAAGATPACPTSSEWQRRRTSAPAGAAGRRSRRSAGCRSLPSRAPSQKNASSNDPTGALTMEAPLERSPGVCSSSGDGSTDRTSQIGRWAGRPDARGAGEGLGDRQPGGRGRTGRDEVGVVAVTTLHDEQTEVEQRAGDHLVGVGRPDRPRGARRLAEFDPDRRRRDVGRLARSCWRRLACR